MKTLKKKYQIFISSTYIDLIEERQAAVEAIVKMGHIPAGMELFKAGKSQWQTITKWIDESDIYILILGGRYGSINLAEGKSYTHLEYEYALSQGKPAFALVLEDDFINKKEQENPELAEVVNKEKYEEFKELVKTKIVKFIEDIKDIKIELPENVRNLEETCHLEGWSKGGNPEEGLKYLEKILKITEENQKLKAKITLLENKLTKQSQEVKFSGGLTFIELKKTLENENLDVPEELIEKIGGPQINLLLAFLLYNKSLSQGVKNQTGVGNEHLFIYHRVASSLITFGLADIKKGPGTVYWNVISLNEKGKEFYVLLKRS
ncbi:MAG: DUF4062 domain-containing protein [Fusobacteriaceae bacterium]